MVFLLEIVDGMQQEGTKLETSPDIKMPLAMRALRRSNIRKKIAEYLFDISPSYSYTSEIAYHIKTTPSNVIGAIRGMESRYREDESLISLDKGFSVLIIGEDKQMGKLIDCPADKQVKIIIEW